MSRHLERITFDRCLFQILKQASNTPTKVSFDQGHEQASTDPKTSARPDSTELLAPRNNVSVSIHLTPPHSSNIQPIHTFLEGLCIHLNCWKGGIHPVAPVGGVNLHSSQVCISP